MKKLFNIVLFLFVLSACSSQKAATSSEPTNDEINKMLEDQSFTFVARQMNPPGGRSRFLTETYTLTVNNNKLVVDLPYFGRATQATIGTEGGFRFTSEKYKYEKAPAKKGWKVTVRPEDNTDVQVFYLSVLENGSASVSVSSNSRQTISYDGTITAVASPK